MSRCLGRSVGPSVCLKNLLSFKHWNFDMMMETKYVSLFDKILNMFLYILIYVYFVWVSCSYIKMSVQGCSFDTHAPIFDRILYHTACVIKCHQLAFDVFEV